MSGGLSAPGGFFADADFDYEARIALGSTVSGIGDVGLVLATLDKITDGDPQSWFDAWTGVAADLAARGEQALGAGIWPPRAGRCFPRRSITPRRWSSSTGWLTSRCCCRPSGGAGLAGRR